MACDVLAGRQRAPGGVIYENAYWMLDHALSPAPLRGFLILKPTRHCEHLGELTAEEAAALGPVLRAACAALQRVTGAEKVYVISFGEVVKHIHFYLIPRLPGMTPHGLRLITQIFGEGTWACTDAEAAETAARVREALAPIA
jgi:diadenosine tetraphosphate (Ap4A) HIT family hydrolase